MGIVAYIVAIGVIYMFIQYDLNIFKVVDYVIKGVRVLIMQLLIPEPEQVRDPREAIDAPLKTVQISPVHSQKHNEILSVDKSDTFTPARRRVSRHGFDGDFTEDILSPLTPTTAFSARSSASKHGFYDADDWEYKNTSFGTTGYVPRTEDRGNLLFPDSPGVRKQGNSRELGGDETEDNLSPLSQASSTLRNRIAARRRRRDFEDLLSPQSGAGKENTDALVMEQVVQLFHKQTSMASDLARRDEMREKDLQQVATKRRVLLESTSQTQGALMREYEAEESRESAERAAKAEEVQAVLSGSSSSINISRLSTLLEDARGFTLPLQPTQVAQLERFLATCAAVVDEAQRLSSLLDGNDMAETETFEELARVLARNEAERLLRGSNPVIVKATALLGAFRKQREAEKAALAEERDRLEREKVVLPPLPSKDSALTELHVDSFLSEEKAIPDFLNFGAQLAGVMANPGAPLSKEQRYLLWREIFEAVLRRAAAVKTEKELFLFAIVLFGAFYTLRKGNAKLCPGCYRILSEVFMALSPVCVPKLAVLEAEEGVFLSSKEARLRLVTLMGAVSALEVEASQSTLDAWTWLARLTKYLRRIETKVRGAQPDAVLGIVIEVCRAIRNYLRLAGPVLLLRFREDLLRENTGLLRVMTDVVRDLLSTGPIFAASTESNTTQTAKAYAATKNLLTLLEGAASTGRFDSVPFHSVSFLNAQMTHAYMQTHREKAASIYASNEYKAQQRVRGSIPHRLLRIAGLLTKENKAELVKQLVVDIGQQQPELLSPALVTIAEEIVKKCCDEQFIHTNLTNPLDIANIVTDLCSSKLGTAFGNLVKAEFSRVCPMTIPTLARGVKQEKMVKIICTFALCCVQDSNALSMSDAWAWLASLVNLASQQATVHPDTAEALNTFLRVASEGMLKAYGNPFTQVVLSLDNKVLPLVEESVERKRLKEFMEHFKKGRVAPIFVNM